MLLFQNNFALWGVFCRFDISLPPLETIIFSVPCFLSGIRNWTFICSYIVSPRLSHAIFLHAWRDMLVWNHSFPISHGGTSRIQSSWMALRKPGEWGEESTRCGHFFIGRKQIVYLQTLLVPELLELMSLCCCFLWKSLLLLLLTIVMMMTLTISLESPPKDPFLVVSRFYALNLYQCPITENPMKSREIPISCWWFNTIFFHGSGNIGFYNGKHHH